jgi:hypothetical protein
MMRQTVRVVLIGMVSAVALVGASSGAQAQNFLTNLFGGGSAEPAINYSERAPLVLPKERKLVEPGAVDTASGEWPNDPDEIKRRKKEEEAIVTNEFFGRKSLAPMSPDELRASGYAEDDPAEMQAIEEYGRRASRPLKPDVLRSQNLRGLGMMGEEPMVAGQEPPRRSLTEPPEGLRTPVASAPLDDSIELQSEIAARAKKNWWEFAPQ